MSFINVASITIMFLVSSGWISRFKSQKIQNILETFLTFLLFYVFMLFGFSIMKLIEAGTLQEMLNTRVEYIVYLVFIVIVVFANIRRTGYEMLGEHYDD